MPEWMALYFDRLKGKTRRQSDADMQAVLRDDPLDELAALRVLDPVKGKTAEGKKPLKVLKAPEVLWELDVECL